MIGIIDYGLGNLRSVANVLELLGVPFYITNDIKKLEKADKYILPGVGNFVEGINNLKKSGLYDLLNEQVLHKKKYFLGICLGMQLICKKSNEGGACEGFGWIDAEVIKFQDIKLRVPHIGWNEVKCNLKSPIFFGGNETQTFYFVHSYYVYTKNTGIIIGKCEYGIEFCAALQNENIFATQFHPEKSQYEGIEIIKKFAGLVGY